MLAFCKFYMYIFLAKWVYIIIYMYIISLIVIVATYMGCYYTHDIDR